MSMKYEVCCHIRDNNDNFSHVSREFTEMEEALSYHKRLMTAFTAHDSNALVLLSGIAEFPKWVNMEFKISNY